MADRVFVNRTLNLKKIVYLGFDMDHTLVRYNSKNFEGLAHRTILKKLVQQKAYPESILTLPFEYDRAIRGLVMDRRRGNLLKLNRYAGIRMSHHGLKPVDYPTQKNIYKSIYIDLSDPGYLAIDTAFSIALALLFGQLVEIADQQPEARLPGYEQISRDIEDCLDEAHRDGSLKDEVRKNLSHFLLKDPRVAEGLERFKRHGKKLFVLTNSHFAYTKLLLDYTISPYLKEHANWQELFEFVIVGAQKPRFFWDRLPLFRIHDDSGTMLVHEGAFDRGVYHGGCASVLTKELGVSGEDILYIGDHIYGDIVRLKKDCNWRTGLVVEELEDEINKLQQVAEIDRRIQALMLEKEPFEQEMLRLSTEAKDKGQRYDDASMEALQAQTAKVDQKLSQLIAQHQSVFNPSWGEVMRIGSEESFFASQVERYACIYMPELLNLLECSPRTYFRAFRRRMPHELG